MEKVKILYKKVDELTPYANNPRHNDGAVDAVAESIKEFGFKVPIIIDEDGEIIAGHTRLKASKKLGMEEVPCIVANDLTPEQVKAFRLADNKVGELATWDFELLESELEAIESFDMVDFGFDEAELKDYAKILLSVIEDRTTILREDKPSSSRLHPTMKPVPLIAKQIKNSSRKGEIVLDIFGGSGTTLIACEQTGRKARLVELDPVYCDVIVKRWEEFTGEKAVKINE